ncbi:hypothetical protein [Jannaschia seohaensis]|uniref:Uncharacterized protein n=1 Tax=Jannaschia seohaensis TaxID=475081 RepID=A0A2Y9C271_9RHOB|nr:hypothetical protein [Jannaschia seohaensis]PWJ16182.1 hypothetical protein BCF38_10966 [Jannaschia seohaensis]SSA49192.1 hypothetical protein SAMN05421539_10966 [Jannaschia seohaensis]
MAHLTLAPLILAVLFAVIGSALSLQSEHPRARLIGLGLLAGAAMLVAIALLT